MQVISGNLRLHLDCDITATRNPHPLYVNVGLDAAPQVLGDKKTQANIEMWEWGRLHSSENVSVTFALSGG